MKNEKHEEAKSLPVAGGQKLATPEQWAAECGNVRERKRRGFGASDPGLPGFSALHLGASQAHGWAEHGQHTGEPLLITKDDYLTAVEATGRGSVHQPAESPLARVARETRRKIVDERIALARRGARRINREVNR